MWGRLTSRFKIDGGKIVLEGIDLVTDGAVSHAVGEVDTARWPEQTYAVRSRIDFPRMKALFWARDKFTLTGKGEFAGTYHLFRGGRELAGRFASLDMRLNDWRFSGMEGSLLWTRDRFEVTKTRSGFYGGRLSIDYSMKPLGDPARPGIARLETGYEGVDVAGLMEARGFAGLRLDGRATGRNALDLAARPLPRAQRRRRDPRRGGGHAAGPDAAIGASGDRRSRRRGRRTGVHRAAAGDQRQGLPGDAAPPGADVPAHVHDADRRRHPLHLRPRVGDVRARAGSPRPRPTSSCRAGPHGAIDRRSPST